MSSGMLFLVTFNLSGCWQGLTVSHTRQHGIFLFSIIWDISCHILHPSGYIGYPYLQTHINILKSVQLLGKTSGQRAVRSSHDGQASASTYPPRRPDPVKSQGQILHGHLGSKGHDEAHRKHGNTRTHMITPQAAILGKVNITTSRTTDKGGGEETQWGGGLKTGTPPNKVHRQGCT